VDKPYGDFEMPPLPPEEQEAAAEPEPSVNPTEHLDAPDVNQALQIATPEAEAEASEPQVEAAPKETSNTRNLKAIRDRALAADKLERERDEARRELAQYKSAPRQDAPRQDSPSIVPDEDYMAGIGNDDLFEGKHAKAMQKQTQKQINELREELKQARQQQEASSVEMRLKSEYPDINSVISEENIKTLKLVDPELAEYLAEDTNFYRQAVAAYKAIKKHGIVETNATYAADIARAHENAKKPKSMASVSPQQGNTPLSQANRFANGMSNDMKNQVYKEMLADINRGRP
jgi:hypothetical protein